jgi:hypothetical protein
MTNLPDRTHSPCDDTKRKSWGNPSDVAPTFDSCHPACHCHARAAAPSRAADQFYLGDWKIDSAVEARWARPKISASEKNSLMGKTVMVKAKEIAGPQPFACKGATYKVTDYSADMLFQGAFEEMRDINKSADPQKLAESLGFSGTTFQTLETGCEIDWHFVNPTTAKIGLNNFVYTLKKQ